MPQPPSIGTLSKFGFGPANPVTKAYEYVGTFNLGKHGKVVATDGIRGTRSRHQERTRTGEYTCSGQVTIEPGPADLDDFLPWILGGTKVGDIIPLGDTFVDQFLTIDRIAALHTYAGGRCDKATFKAGVGQMLSVAMDVEAKTETLGAVAGFAALIPSLSVPYYFTDATLTYGGVTHQFREVEITVDNMLKKDRFMNSTTRTDLPPLDRVISVSLSLPYTTDQSALYDQNATPGHVVVTFTNGSLDLIFDMIAVQFPTEPPETPGREEILLPLKGQARKSGTTLELICSNKSS